LKKCEKPNMLGARRYDSISEKPSTEKRVFYISVVTVKAGKECEFVQF